MPAAGAESANRRSMGMSVEPEGGFEPPTCRLRGHSSLTTMSKADKAAQLRRADRQGRNGLAKGGRLAETLAEQSRLSGAPRQFDRPFRDRACARAMHPDTAMSSWST